MYSGITGQEFAADIYIGCVYYQRLRHMVLDKFQVRTTGPVDPVTRQPVKVRSITYMPCATEYSRRCRVVNVLVVSVSVRWSVMLSSHMERRSCSKTVS